MNSSQVLIATLILIALGFTGCANRPPPLSYLALERPKGVITTSAMNHKTYPGDINSPNCHYRGGFYFLNYGFRPAPDLNAYLQETQAREGTEILRQADIQLGVPVIFYFLPLGYQIGFDFVTIE